MGQTSWNATALARFYLNHRNSKKSTLALEATPARQDDMVLEQEAFQGILAFERRRAERSRSPFVLMLLDAKRGDGTAEKLLGQAGMLIASSTRETDLVGWYEKGGILGAIFTEVTESDMCSVTANLRDKVTAALRASLGNEAVAKIAISMHTFPDNWDRNQPGSVVDTRLYPDLQPQMSRKKISLSVKRAMDIIGSAALLLLMSPVLVALALVIKLTSKGPVLFCQERLGRFGIRFKCLKFRTMYTNCDASIHQAYIQQFIAGQANTTNENPAAPTVYKITDDPRVTSIGRWLRKTSLDEFPQFWNVLVGDMSLVGPRPPVPYEWAIYDIWHRRRVLEITPGITGLWQVSGRSRTRFNEMVRLDLQYCQSWSLWLDLKILLATPRAVFSGEGAY